MTTLKELLLTLIEGWNTIPIRIFQDGKWRALYLSEIRDGSQILQWVQDAKGTFWE